MDYDYEEYDHDDEEHVYSCETCNFRFPIISSDIERIDVHDALMDVENDFYPCSSNSTIKVNINVTTDCQNRKCNAKVKVVVSVLATPLFEEEGEYNADRPAKLVGYEIEDLQLLPSGSIVDDMIHNPDFLLINEEPDFHEEQDIEWDLQNTEVPNEQNLRIVCKTRMGGGFCYMGLDEDNQRLLRPILHTKPGACCWSQSSNFEVGSLVSFEVLHDPLSQTEADFKTPYPHRNEDMLVEKDRVVVVSENTEWSPKSLLPLAKTNIQDVFPIQLVKENKYLLENTKCPSVGVFLTEERHLHVYTTYNKPRVRVDIGGSRYDWPLTAFKWDVLQPAGNRKCIVILGLARPFKGYKNEYNPSRCYILVIGIHVLGE